MSASVIEMQRRALLYAGHGGPAVATTVGIAMNNEGWVPALFVVHVARQVTANKHVMAEKGISTLRQRERLARDNSHRNPRNVKQNVGWSARACCFHHKSVEMN